MKYTYEKVTEMALDEAERKLKTGKLFKCSDLPKHGWTDKDFENGDPETIYTIASTYEDALDENLNNSIAYDKILDALIEKYPEYM